VSVRARRRGRGGEVRTRELKESRGRGAAGFGANCGRRIETAKKHVPVRVFELRVLQFSNDNGQNEIWSNDSFENHPHS
jgi:hypothetical protein